MATKREQLNSQIAELERQVYFANEEIARIKGELQTTPAAVLDVDTEAATAQEIARKNAILRERGLLPAGK